MGMQVFFVFRKMWLFLKSCLHLELVCIIYIFLCLVKSV